MWIILVTLLSSSDGMIKHTDTTASLDKVAAGIVVDKCVRVQ